MKIIIAGGSGLFLGLALAEVLAGRGYEPVILTRRPRSGGGLARQIAWDGRTLGSWADELDGAGAVVNLAGKSVNCRYTAQNRREIVASRVDSVQVIGQAIARCQSPPPVWVQAGSLAIYGDAGERVCGEDVPWGTGFPAETCVAWEAAFAAAALPGTRQVLLRIGFVLGQGGGALPTLAGLTRWGLGGPAGIGRQYISWLHLRDMNAMFVQVIEREDLAGVLNATGPKPVTNADFMRELRKTLGRPWSPPVPAWAMRLGAVALQTEAELALTGRRCGPKRFVDAGFTFTYPHLPEALKSLLAVRQNAG